MSSTDERYGRGALRICELEAHRFDEDPLPTERDAYHLLRRLQLPIEASYVAVPWAALLHGNQLDQLPALELRHAFTICQSARYRAILPILRRWNVGVVFSPHAGPELPDVRVVPFPMVAVNGVGPAPVKDIRYSFVGLDSSWNTRAQVRRALLAMTHPADARVIERAAWHFETSDAQRAAERLEYRDILARSRFSLCPRGYGRGTIRFWESLQAGAIPVVLADGLRLPEGLDWEDCILRVAERDYAAVPDLIASISPAQEQQMRMRCLAAYAEHSNASLVGCVTRYLEARTDHESCFRHSQNR